MNSLNDDDICTTLKKNVVNVTFYRKRCDCNIFVFTSLLSTVLLFARMFLLEVAAILRLFTTTNNKSFTADL